MVRCKTEMKKRVVTSVAVILGMLLLAIFSDYIVYPIGMAVLSLIAVFEVLRVIGVQKNLFVSLPAYIIASALPVCAFFATAENVTGLLLIIAAAMFVYLLWLFGVSVFSRGSIPFSRISEVFAAVTYVAVSFTSLSLIRYLDPALGIYFLVLVFLIAWSTDVFAFAVGMLFGKHKLIPEVSPKKSVEGAIGGVAFCALLCFVYGLGADMFIPDIRVNYLTLVLFGLILSVVSQLGDLTASLIKREYGVKDYGTIFPGHGGVMDRFDSVLAVSTILLILCLVFPPFAIA